MASTVLHPHSSGSVRIGSGSVWDMPLIDPGYLKDSRDVEVRSLLPHARLSPARARASRDCVAGAYAQEVLACAQVLLAGLRLIRRMSNTAPLSSYLLKPASPSMTPEEFANATDEQLLEHARETAETIYHPMGSCKIGASRLLFFPAYSRAMTDGWAWHTGPREEGGAIDPSLRVYGLSNVRVCDASVFPDTVSGHPVRLTFPRY